jgi:hypothetical protein
MRTPSFIRRPRLGLRSAAIIVGTGALAVTAGLGVKSYEDFQAYAAPHTVEFSMSYKAIPDLKTLNQSSELVVVGRVIQGSTKLIPFQTETPHANDAPVAPNLPPAKAEALAKNPASGPLVPAAATDSVRETRNAGLGTPVTVFDVQIEQVLRGEAREGAAIKVTQPGGNLTLDTFPGGPKLQRSVIFEHDTLMQAGERHVLFLTRGADGTYSVAGGPQGRMAVDNGDKLHPIDASAPALKGHAGQTVSSLALDVDRER